MAQAAARILDAGNLFPSMVIRTLDGEISIPADLDGPASVILVYRGEW